MNLNTRIQTPMMTRPQASKLQAQRSGNEDFLAKKAAEDLQFRQGLGKVRLLGFLARMQEYLTLKSLMPNGDHQSPWDKIDEPDFITLLSRLGIHPGMTAPEVDARKRGLIASFRS
ncbi:MAG: hypothetical protein ACK551_01835 [Vampirovibrionales bacterium]